MKNHLLKTIVSSRKNLISVIFFCLLLLATFIALVFPPQTLSSVDQFRVEWINTLSVEPNAVAIQSFEATDDFSGFGLLFAETEQVFDQGGVKIDIYGQQELIDTCYVEAKNFIRSSFFYCRASITRDRQYELVISVENTSLPVVFLTTAANINNASLSLDKKVQNQLIIMDFTKQRDNYMLAWFFAILANLSACYIAANLGKELYDSKKN